MKLRTILMLTVIFIVSFSLVIAQTKKDDSKKMADKKSDCCMKISKGDCSPTGQSSKGCSSKKGNMPKMDKESCCPDGVKGDKKDCCQDMSKCLKAKDGAGTTDKDKK